MSQLNTPLTKTIIELSIYTTLTEYASPKEMADEEDTFLAEINSKLINL